ncbi:MAG TPA: phosphatase PAP2 family protein [Flavisolibacter sp.]|nr:phosphatase PAP2 family protein [Flavisolibacter sp.]
MKQFRLRTGKTFCFFIVLQAFSCSLSAQQNPRDTASKLKTNLTKFDTISPAVYNIPPLRTAAIGIAATAANMIAINNVLHNKKDLSLTEVQALRGDIVNPIDRWALELDPTKRDRFYRLSDHALTAVLAGSAATFIFNKRTRKDWLRIGLMYYETQFLTFAFYDFSPIGPFFQNRVRPVSYYEHFPIELRRRGNQRNSFYSGHAANATSATFFAVKVYCDYHPEIGKKKYLLYGLASVPALFCGWARIKALAHFPSDVLVGYVVGGFFGIMIPEMHRIKSNKIKLGTFYNGQSGGLHLTYKVGKQKIQG